MTGVLVGVGVGVEVGTSTGVFEGRGVFGAGRVGSLVGVRVCTLGTKIRVPARIKVELPRQFANCSSATETPKSSPIRNKVSPGLTV